MKDNYGDNWGPATNELGFLLKNYGNSANAFLEALKLGYFSSYTGWQIETYIEEILNWQLQCLEKKFGAFFKFFPPGFSEIDIVPPKTIKNFHNHKITPDFLRNIFFSLEIASKLKMLTKKAPILEIGSGYGGLARCLKTIFPDQKIWLVDTKEALCFANFYLKKTLPNSSIYFCDDEKKEIKLDDFDFVLIPAEKRKILKSKNFSLAINIFSLGEMPNSFINEYFSLLQDESETENLFLLNSILHPVTPETIIS